MAVRIGRAETASHGTIEHAVILVEGGKIIEIGEDLPVERGIPILDRPDWVATPGFVNPYSRAGMDARAGKAATPQRSAAFELRPHQGVYDDMLEAGVTTLGLYPPGTGMPGQAIAIRTGKRRAEEALLKEGCYLKVTMGTTAQEKKDLIKAFESADKHEEKVQKEREKWEKDQEKKKKKKKKSKKDDDKMARLDDDEKGDDGFEPPAADPDVQPILDMRAGDLHALIRIQKASDLLHLLDVIEEEEGLSWSLRVPLRNDIDLFEVADKIGELDLRVVLDSRVTLEAGTRRERNLAAELTAAGAHVVLLPLSDSAQGHERWRMEVAHLVSLGLDREAALAAMTLEGAHVLGLEERLGSLDKEKDANIVFWNGDPFEPGTKIEAVMLDGRFATGDPQ